MTYTNNKLRKDARGQTCQNCGAQDGTIVSAHANGCSSGKGIGIKASDVLTAWLCYHCHAWLDQGSGMDPTGLYHGTRAEKWEMWARAFQKTMERRFEQGLVECV